MIVGEIREQVLAVVRLGDAARLLLRLREPSPRLGAVARDRVRPRERLVGEAEVPVADPVLLAELEAAARVVERRLGPAEDGVDPRALPLAPGEVLGRADLPPVVRRRVRGVDQLVVLLGRPLARARAASRRG